MPASAICWSRHSNSDYWQIAICVFLWSIKCQHRVWQQRYLHRRYKAQTLIGVRWPAGKRGTWSQLAPEHTAGGRIHQSTAFITRALLPKIVGKVLVDSSSVVIEILATFCIQDTASRNLSLSSSYLSNTLQLKKCTYWVKFVVSGATAGFIWLCVSSTHSNQSTLFVVLDTVCWQIVNITSTLCVQ